MSLDTAEEALERGDVDTAAAALLAAWRETPYAELADALDRFPVRRGTVEAKKPTARMQAWLQRWSRVGALDVPGLLDEVDRMLVKELPRFVRPCFDALSAAAPDPRVGRRALAWSREPAGRLMLKPLISVLWKHVSPRDLPELRRFVNEVDGGRFSPILKTVERRAAALRPLDAPLRGRIIELGLRAAKAPVSAAPTAGEPELLERLRAAPEDTACREVFSDWLLTQGDAWGELIALQEQRARSGEQKVTARERSLLKELRPRILGSLAGVKKSVLDDLVFERGFLVSATVKQKGVTRVAALMSRPELSTLERVTFLRDAALTPNLRALREVHGVSPETLTAWLKKVPEPQLEAVTVENALNAFVDVPWWPKLRELYVTLHYALALSAVLRSASVAGVARQLSALGCREAFAPTAFQNWSWEVIDRLPPNVSRVLIETMGGLDARFELTRASDGWDVTVGPSERRLSRLAAAHPMPLDKVAVQHAKVVLRESRSVTLSDGLSAELRDALG